MKSPEAADNRALVSVLLAEAENLAGIVISGEEPCYPEPDQWDYADMLEVCLSEVSQLIGPVATAEFWDRLVDKLEPKS